MRSAHTPIAFDVPPSRAIALATAAVGVAAAAAPWFSGAPISVRVAVCAIALAGGIASLLRSGAPRVARIAFDAAGWTLVDRRGEAHPAELLRHRAVGPLQVLDFRAAGRRWQVVLAPDNVDVQVRRRLAVRAPLLATHGASRATG